MFLVFLKSYENHDKNDNKFSELSSEINATKIIISLIDRGAKKQIHYQFRKKIHRGRKYKSVNIYE